MKTRRQFVRNVTGAAELVWETQDWLGGDINKLWFKTEGDDTSQLSVVAGLRFWF